MAVETNDLTTPEVAALFNCSPKTVCRLAKRGKLPGYRVGRDWRFTPDAVRNFRRPVDPPHNPIPKSRVLASSRGKHLPGWGDFDYR